MICIISYINHNVYWNKSEQKVLTFITSYVIMSMQLALELNIRVLVLLAHLAQAIISLKHFCSTFSPILLNAGKYPDFQVSAW